jgi:hypothetical protein
MGGENNYAKWYSEKIGNHIQAVIRNRAIHGRFVD